MAQKFIITKKGYFRLGDVRLHKHLLQAGDLCYGGGFYQFDYINGQLLLDGVSYDYGKPHWNWLIADDTTLKIPEAYRGMQIVYRPDDREKGDFVVTREMKIEYV